MEDFTIDNVKNQSPWKEQNFHGIKPTMDIMKKEIQRRDANVRGMSNLKFDGVIALLKEKNSCLTPKCIEFILKEYNRFKNIFEACAK